MRQLLDRTYFVRKMLAYQNEQEPVCYTFFRQYLRCLEDDYRNRIETQRPYSLAGRILTNRLFAPIITKSCLVNADLVLSHLSPRFVSDDDLWYPMLAPYWRSVGKSVLWSRLVSRAYCKKLYPLFDAASLDELIQSVADANKSWEDSYISRGGLAYGGIPSIKYFTAIEKIGSLP